MMCTLNLWTVDLARQGKNIIGHLKLRATEYFKKTITVTLDGFLLENRYGG